jgi:hypothetical protein
MKGKSRYFINRNEKVAPIKFGEETLDATVRIPSNYEHDSMMESHTEYGQDKKSHQLNLVKRHWMRLYESHRIMNMIR